MKRKFLFNSLRVFLAVVFVFSAISKLVSMPFFDGLVAEFLLGDNYLDNASGLYWTQLLTRVLVSGELIVGIALLQNKWFKTVVMPAVMLLMLVFTIHLFFEGFASEKGFVEGNCGCFGDVLPMTILESILKNIVATLIAIALWVAVRGKEIPKIDSRSAAWVVGLVTLGTLLFSVKSYTTTPEMPTSSSISLVDSIYETSDTSVLNSPEKGKDTVKDMMTVKVDKGAKTKNDGRNKSDAGDNKLSETESKNQDAEAKKSKPEIAKTVEILNKYGPHSDGKRADLVNGRRLVMLFSMTCSHCQEVYKAVCGWSQNNDLPQIYMYNYGKDFEQKYFFNQAGSCNHPFYRTEDYIAFNRMLEGKDFPRILVIDKGKVIKEWDIDSYSDEDFMTYFNIKVEEKEDGLKLNGGGSFGW
jgi:uncharacterized membrane protein YphA (DoxX/SURF4 family)